jgi:hypothetical protein
VLNVLEIPATDVEHSTLIVIIKIMLLDCQIFIERWDTSCKVPLYEYFLRQNAIAAAACSTRSRWACIDWSISFNYYDMRMRN